MGAGVWRPRVAAAARGRSRSHLRDEVPEVAGKKLCGVWGVESDIW